MQQTSKETSYDLTCYKQLHQTLETWHATNDTLLEPDVLKQDSSLVPNPLQRTDTSWVSKMIQATENSLSRFKSL